MKKIEILTNEGNVITVNFDNNPYAYKECEHFSVQLDLAASELECTSCGKKLNPIQWLYRFMKEWDRLKDNREEAEESPSKITAPSKNLLGGQDLAKHLIDVFVQSNNKPMQTPELIALLEELSDPIKTTASRITGAVHNSKDKFESLEGKRGVYKLKDDYYLTLTKKDQENPIS